MNIKDDDNLMSLFRLLVLVSPVGLVQVEHGRNTTTNKRKFSMMVYIQMKRKQIPN